MAILVSQHIGMTDLKKKKIVQILVWIIILVTAVYSSRNATVLVYFQLSVVFSGENQSKNTQPIMFVSHSKVIIPPSAESISAHL